MQVAEHTIGVTGHQQCIRLLACPRVAQQYFKQWKIGWELEKSEKTAKVNSEVDTAQNICGVP